MAVFVGVLNTSFSFILPGFGGNGGGGAGLVAIKGSSKSSSSSAGGVGNGGRLFVWLFGLFCC